MNDFTNLGSLVNEVKNLVSKVSGGAILAMNSQFSDLKNQMSVAIQKANNITSSSINKMMKQTLYIDQTNGSDTNSGSSSSPLKSFYAASKKTVSNGIVYINLLSDYDFSLDVNQPTFDGGEVIIKSDNKKITLGTYLLNEEPNNFYMKSFYLLNSASIELNGTDLILPEIPKEHVAGKKYPHGAAVFKSYSGSSVSCNLVVRLNRVNVIVPDSDRSEWHLIGNPSGITNMCFSGVTTPNDWRNRNKLSYSMHKDFIKFARMITNYSGAIIEGGRNTGVVA